MQFFSNEIILAIDSAPQFNHKNCVAELFVICNIASSDELYKYQKRKSVPCTVHDEQKHIENSEKYLLEPKQ